MARLRFSKDPESFLKSNFECLTPFKQSVECACSRTDLQISKT